MKKRVFVLVSCLFVALNSYANDGYSCGACMCKNNKHEMMGGGFVDNALKPMSVAEIEKQSDDTYVAVVGNIIKQVGDDKYEFSDGSNSILVKIKPNVWQGQRVSPKDKVMIMGEVDREFVGGKMIKVKQLKLME